MYEVTERQQLHEKASFEREKDAIEELYEIVKFRCRIKKYTYSVRCFRD